MDAPAPTESTLVMPLPRCVVAQLNHAAALQRDGGPQGSRPVGKGGRGAPPRWAAAGTNIGVAVHRARQRLCHMRASIVGRNSRPGAPFDAAAMHKRATYSCGRAGAAGSPGARRVRAHSTATAPEVACFSAAPPAHGCFAVRAAARGPYRLIIPDNHLHASGHWQGCCHLVPRKPAAAPPRK